MVYTEQHLTWKATKVQTQAGYLFSWDMPDPEHWSLARREKGRTHFISWPSENHLGLFAGQQKISGIPCFFIHSMLAESRLNPETHCLKKKKGLKTGLRQKTLSTLINSRCIKIQWQCVNAQIVFMQHPTATHWHLFFCWSNKSHYTSNILLDHFWL